MPYGLFTKYISTTWLIRLLLQRCFLLNIPAMDAHNTYCYKIFIGYDYGTRGRWRVTATAAADENIIILLFINNDTVLS